MNRKFLIILLLIFATSSCGFQVIYKDQFDENSIAHQLASISIKKDRKQLAQALKNNLYDVLNPDYIKAETKYFLELNLETNIAPTFTNISGASGRNKATLTVSYVLKNIKTAQIISQGKTDAYDSYDVSPNRYATYTADEYVKENLTNVIAQKIRNSIVNDIIEEKRECEENKDVKNYKCLIE
jgi:hypothetical protein